MLATCFFYFFNVTIIYHRTLSIKLDYYFIKVHKNIYEKYASKTFLPFVQYQSFFWKYTNKSEDPRNSNVSSSYSDSDFRALGHIGNSRGSSVVNLYDVIHHKV